MESQALVIGRSYAYREKRSPACPLLKVKLLDKVGRKGKLKISGPTTRATACCPLGKVGRKGKLKIRCEGGPHPGLEEYVSSRQLVVPWGERRALLRDEERAARLEQHARGLSDKALTEAASAVLESTGEPGAYAGETTTWMSEAELQRTLDRAGVQTPPADLHPFAYRDRHGNIHLSLDAVVAVARAFAAAEPQTVISYLDDREEELRLKGNLPGERWHHEYLRELSPGFALARQWAGLERESEMLRKEIARLRGLLSNAAYDLKSAGQELKASRLLRALEGAEPPHQLSAARRPISQHRVDP